MTKLLKKLLEKLYLKLCIYFEKREGFIYLTEDEKLELKKVGDYLYDYVKDEKLKYIYSNYFHIMTINSYNSSDPSIYSLGFRRVLAKDIKGVRYIYGDINFNPEIIQKRKEMV